MVWQHLKNKMSKHQLRRLLETAAKSMAWKAERAVPRTEPEYEQMKQNAKLVTQHFVPEALRGQTDIQVLEPMFRNKVMNKTPSRIFPGN